MRTSALVLAGLLTGCAGTSAFVPLDRIEHVDPKKYPDDDAVILRRDVAEHAGSKGVTLRRYERIAVLRKGGLRAAHAVIPLQDGGALLSLRTRVIGPHGARVVTVTPKKTSFANRANVQVPALAFDLPGVEVGDIVEYEWRVTRPTPTLSSQEYPLSAEDPLVAEELTLTATAPTTFETRTYNLATPPETSQQGGAQIIRLVLHDVAPDRHEPFEAPELISRPWIFFRLLPDRTTKYTWPGALTRAADVLYPATLYLPDSLALAHGPVVPAQKNAFLERAIASLASTDPISLGWLENVRPFVEIAASRNASSTERAVLLKAQLDRAQIESHFAVVADRDERLDPTFPESWIRGHAVLSIPEQPGIAAPLLVDPTCASCALGELPPWTARSPQFPVHAISFWREHGIVTTQPLRFLPTRVPPSVRRRAWTFALDENGASTAELVTEQSDTHAFREGWQVRDPRAALEHSRETVKRDPFFVAETVTPATYDARTNTLRTKVRGHAQLATRTAQSITLPLTMLSPGPVPALGAPRSTAVSFRIDSTWTEEVDVQAPAGWKIASLPAPRRREAPGVVVTVESTRTPNGAVVRYSIDKRAGDYPPSAYAQIVAACRETFDVSRESIVFSRR